MVTFKDLLAGRLRDFVAVLRGNTVAARVRGKPAG